MAKQQTTSPDQDPHEALRAMLRSQGFTDEEIRAYEAQSRAISGNLETVKEPETKSATDRLLEDEPLV